MRLSYLLVLFCFLLFTQRSSSSPYVCSEALRADLTSFYINQNSKAVVSQDDIELCELCGRIVRLAYIYSNDITSQRGWSDALNNNACGYVEEKRSEDCNRLVFEISRSQRSYFDGSDSKFSESDWSQDTDSFAQLLDGKAFSICKQISCCSINSRRSPPITPVKYVDDNARDRQAIEDDLAMMKKVKEQVLQVRYDTQKLQDQVSAKEADLVTREKKLKDGQNQLANDQNTLKNNQKELTAREAKQTQVESDFQDQAKTREATDDAREERIAKVEADLSTRETAVSQREVAAGIQPSS